QRRSSHERTRPGNCASMEPMVERKATWCSICEATCGLIATVDGDRVVALAPDAEHVVSRGYACHKGVHQHELAHSPARLTAPHKRVGGRFVAISWAQALAEIGAKLRALRAAHGGDAIATYLGNPISLPDPVGRLAAIVRRGGRVVFVDPRRTESARSLGEHVFIRPDTDVFFYLAFLHELIARGACDRARVERYMRGFDTLAAVVAP